MICCLPLPSIPSSPRQSLLGKAVTMCLARPSLSWQLDPCGRFLEKAWKPMPGNGLGSLGWCKRLAVLWQLRHHNKYQIAPARPIQFLITQYDRQIKNFTPGKTLRQLQTTGLRRTKTRSLSLSRQPRFWFPTRDNRPQHSSALWGTCCPVESAGGPISSAPPRPVARTSQRAL